MPLVPQNDRRLHVAADVIRDLDPAMLMQLNDLREHTVLFCWLCRASIAPEDDVAAQAVLLRDRGGQGSVLKFACPGCMRSGAHDVEPEPMPDECSTNWEGRPSKLRSGAGSSPVGNGPRHPLVSQGAPELRSDSRPTAQARIPWSYRFPGRTHGACRQRLVSEAPQPPDASERPSLTCRRFDDANPADPAGWIQAAEDTGRVLVVYGSGFGMDRMSPARINTVLQAGEALCALVPYER